MQRVVYTNAVTGQPPQRNDLLNDIMNPIPNENPSFATSDDANYGANPNRNKSSHQNPRKKHIPHLVFRDNAKRIPSILNNNKGTNEHDPTNAIAASLDPTTTNISRNRNVMLCQKDDIKFEVEICPGGGGWGLQFRLLDATGLYDYANGGDLIVDGNPGNTKANAGSTSAENNSSTAARYKELCTQIQDEMQLT